MGKVTIADLNRKLEEHMELDRKAFGEVQKDFGAMSAQFDNYHRENKERFVKLETSAGSTLKINQDQLTILESLQLGKKIIIWLISSAGGIAALVGLWNLVPH